jgi:hypothetical protein
MKSDKTFLEFVSDVCMEQFPDNYTLRTIAPETFLVTVTNSDEQTRSDFFYHMHNKAFVGKWFSSFGAATNEWNMIVSTRQQPFALL